MDGYPRIVYALRLERAGGPGSHTAVLDEFLAARR